MEVLCKGMISSIICVIVAIFMFLLVNYIGFETIISRMMNTIIFIITVVLCALIATVISEA